jgi:hypothetical protein
MSTNRTGFLDLQPTNQYGNEVLGNNETDLQTEPIAPLQEKPFLNPVARIQMIGELAMKRNWVRHPIPPDVRDRLR